MKSLLESELYKKTPQELAQASSRCTTLLMEALQKGDHEQAEKRKLQRHLIAQVLKTKDRLPTNAEWGEWEDIYPLFI